MQKKKFQKPELEFEMFENDDIITTSGPIVSEGENTESGYSKEIELDPLQ